MDQDRTSTQGILHEHTTIKRNVHSFFCIKHTTEDTASTPSLTRIEGEMACHIRWLEVENSPSQSRLARDREELTSTSTSTHARKKLNMKGKRAPHLPHAQHEKLQTVDKFPADEQIMSEPEWS